MANLVHTRTDRVHYNNTIAVVMNGWFGTYAYRQTSHIVHYNNTIAVVMNGWFCTYAYRHITHSLHYNSAIAVVMNGWLGTYAYRQTSHAVHYTSVTIPWNGRSGTWLTDRHTETQTSLFVTVVLFIHILTDNQTYRQTDRQRHRQRHKPAFLSQ